MRLPSHETLIVLPTYNEAQSVPQLLRQLMGIPVDLLFVDDHSTDGTAEILRQAVANHPERCFLIERPGKMGLGSAYVDGFKWALARGYKRILEMDADLSHDPRDVGRLIAASEAHSLVIGSRYVGGARVLNWPLRRLALSVGAAHYVRFITGLPLNDPTSGFKCFRREVLEALELDRIRSNGYSFQIEVNYRAWRMGFVIAEIPITFTERQEGHSKMSAGIIFEALWRTWMLPIRDVFATSSSVAVNRHELNNLTATKKANDSAIEDRAR